jgi:hypothetical protein
VSEKVPQHITDRINNIPPDSPIADAVQLVHFPSLWNWLVESYHLGFAWDSADRIRVIYRSSNTLICHIRGARLALALDSKRVTLMHVADVTQTQCRVDDSISIDKATGDTGRERDLVFPIETPEAVWLLAWGALPAEYRIHQP